MSLQSAPCSDGCGFRSCALHSCGNGRSAAWRWTRWSACLLRRGLLPRCRMPRRRCPAFRRHPGWPRRPRIWRLRPRPRAWRLLISPRPARLRRWHHAWRRRMSQRRRGKWRCRMVGRASPKAVLHLVVPLLTLRAAGPSADDLRPARKGMAANANAAARELNRNAGARDLNGMPPDRRTRPKIVTRWRAPGQQPGGNTAERQGPSCRSRSRDGRQRFAANQ